MNARETQRQDKNLNHSDKSGERLECISEVSPPKSIETDLDGITSAYHANIELNHTSNKLRRKDGTVRETAECISPPSIGRPSSKQGNDQDASFYNLDELCLNDNPPKDFIEADAMKNICDNDNQFETRDANASEFRSNERCTPSDTKNSGKKTKVRNRKNIKLASSGESNGSSASTEGNEIIFDSFDNEISFRIETEDKNFQIPASRKDESTKMQDIFSEDTEYEGATLDEGRISTETKKGLHRILASKFRSTASYIESNPFANDATLDSDRSLKIPLPAGLKSLKDDKKTDKALNNEILEKKSIFLLKERNHLSGSYESSESGEEVASINDSDANFETTINEGESKKASWLPALKKEKKATMLLEEFEPEGLVLDEGSLIESKKGLHRIFGNKFRQAVSQSETNVLLEEDTIEERNLKIRLPRGLRSRKEDKQNDRTPTKERVAEKIQHLRRRIKRRKARDERPRGGEISDSIWDFEQLSGVESDDEVGLLMSRSSDSWSDFNASTPSIGTNPLGEYSDTSSALDDVFRSQLRSERDIRVKPHHVFGSSKIYMTEEELYQNMKRPSQNIEYFQSSMKKWFDICKLEHTDADLNYWGGVDDGRIGSVRVEVLSCTGVSKTKSDISVWLVCGDAAFETDVIQGCRSPIWPYLSKRAACFPLFHAYARVFVGVFDKRKKAENDSFCGRTTIDISSLRPRTVYDLTIPLRASTFVYDRRQRGAIRLRFSLYWFSERAAVLSYLKSPQMMHTTSIMGQPFISCDDPKTFRNIAVTIHGQELPGKYSRDAFQATMREFNLYQINIRFLLQSSLYSAVLYEKPMISLYIFVTWMHCVINSSIRLVPVYFIGLLIFLLIESYFHFAINPLRNLGFKQLSLQEIGLALIETGKSRHKMNTLSIEKEVKSDFEGKKANYECMDHGEFPFSSGEVYTRLTSSETILRRNWSNKQAKSKREEILLQRRLSIYSMQDNDDSEIEGSESIYPSTGEERQIDSDAESEIIGDEDNVCGVESDDSVDANGDKKVNSRDSMAWSSTRSMQSSVIVGPAQNKDEKPRKKIPPQIHLARLEDNLNKLTQSLSMDRLLASSLAYRRQDEESQKFKSAYGGIRPKKNRRIPLDDFDRKLGYRARHPNPVTEITSSFLGPLMRIFRILCVVIRSLFNISVWTDPYLSFWVLCFLILLMIVLLVFPWQLFFCVVGIAAFGPQNIMIRRHLQHLELSKQDPESNNIKYEKKGPLRRLNNSLVSLKERRQKKDNQEIKNETKVTLHSSIQSEMRSSRRSPEKRKKFQAAQASRKFADPREIIVPYSRIRIDRFFNWPPDPAVARATPITSTSSFSNRDRTSSSSSMEKSTVQSIPSTFRRRISSSSSLTEKSAFQSNPPGSSNRNRLLSY